MRRTGGHGTRGSRPWLRRRSGVVPEPSRDVFCGGFFDRIRMDEGETPGEDLPDDPVL